MRDQWERAWRALRDLSIPELTPVTWTIAAFLGVALGGGARARAARSPIPSPESDILGLLVALAFVAFVVLAATVVSLVKDR